MNDTQLTDLAEQFLAKASEYFDYRVSGNDEAAEGVAIDMAILIRRGKALCLAERQPKLV